MKVERIREKQLVGMTDHEFDCKIVNGMTARTKVEHDLNAKSDGGIMVMGKLYYQGIRDMYSSEQSAATRLQPLDNAQPLPSSLSAALQAIDATPRSWAPIMMWLLEYQPLAHGAINQKTVVTLLQRMLKHAVGVNASNNSFNFACLQFIARNGLHQLFSSEWMHMDDHVNNLLKHDLVKAQKSGIETSQWFACHSRPACTMVNKGFVDKIMAVKDGEPWLPLAAEINAVHSTGTFGAHLVSGPFKALKQEQFLQALKKHMDMFEAKDITMELYDHVRKAYCEEMTGHGINVMDPIDGGMSTCTYRGDQFNIAVSSRLDAFIKAFKAHAYSIAVENGQLPSIWEENALMRGDQALKHLKVEDCIIVDQRMARKSAIQAMSVHAEAMTADVLKATMVNQLDQLLSIDPYWMVAHCAFESIVGSQSSARFMSMVHLRLPTPQRMITAIQALSDLNHLQESKVMKFMPSSCQAQLRAIRNAIDCIIHRKRACMPNDGSGAMVSMGTKMSLWLEHTSGTEVMRGKKAMAIMYQDLLDMEEQERMEDMTLAMLEPLVVFAWLLTPLQDQKVATWKSFIMGRNIGNNPALPIQPMNISEAQRDAVVAFSG
jgi:hypothetical protein